MVAFETPERVLAIGAHPDDIEFGCGGTLAQWAQAGAHVVMAVVTDGSKGTWDPDSVPAELVAARAAEQQRAAEVIGAAEVVMLGHVDGELQYTPELRTEMCRLIRTNRPNVLLTHDPWRPYELHPDHRATGWSVIDGLVSARDPLFEPEMGIAPHRPDHLLLWKPQEADTWLDISASWDAKLKALLCHSSQGETTMNDAGVSEANRTRFEERMRAVASEAGEAAGLALAEAFKRIEP